MLSYIIEKWKVKVEQSRKTNKETYKIWFNALSPLLKHLQLSLHSQNNDLHNETSESYQNTFTGTL